MFAHRFIYLPIQFLTGITSSKLFLVPLPVFSLVQVLRFYSVCLFVPKWTCVYFRWTALPFVCYLVFVFFISTLQDLINIFSLHSAAERQCRALTDAVFQRLLFDCRVFHDAPGDWVAAILQRMWEPSLFWIQKDSKRHFKRKAFNFLPLLLLTVLLHRVIRLFHK